MTYPKDFKWGSSIKHSLQTLRSLRYSPAFHPIRDTAGKPCGTCAPSCPRSEDHWSTLLHGGDRRQDQALQHRTQERQWTRGELELAFFFGFFRGQKTSQLVEELKRSVFLCTEDLLKINFRCRSKFFLLFYRRTTFPEVPKWGSSMENSLLSLRRLRCFRLFTLLEIQPGNLSKINF